MDHDIVRAPPQRTPPDHSTAPTGVSQLASRRSQRWTPAARFEKLLQVKQSIVTLDMEGVLTPEIWITVAEKTGIPELRRSTAG